MRLLALLSGISALVAALFFVVAAFLWFGDDDGSDASDTNGLESFAFAFIAVSIGLYLLDRAGVASREIVLQPRHTGAAHPGTSAPPPADASAGYDYRLQ